MRNELNLSAQDINRLVKYLPKTSDNKINYLNFIEIIT